MIQYRRYFETTMYSFGTADLAITFGIEYNYHPGEMATRNHPGSDDEFEITHIEIHAIENPYGDIYIPQGFWAEIARRAVRERLEDREWEADAREHACGKN